MQQIVHYFLHFIFPGFIAYLFFNNKWKKAYVIMLFSMLIDLDHLLVNPIFNPCRCSIGFHPLHSYVAVAFYAALLIHPKTRIIAVGLLLHLATDFIDCLFIEYSC
jgi:Na+/phosphate symporter